MSTQTSGRLEITNQNVPHTVEWSVTEVDGILKINTLTSIGDTIHHATVDSLTYLSNENTALTHDFPIRILPLTEREKITKAIMSMLG